MGKICMASSNFLFFDFCCLWLLFFLLSLSYLEVKLRVKMGNLAFKKHRWISKLCKPWQNFRFLCLFFQNDKTKTLFVNSWRWGEAQLLLNNCRNDNRNKQKNAFNNHVVIISDVIKVSSPTLTICATHFHILFHPLRWHVLCSVAAGPFLTRHFTTCTLAQRLSSSNNNNSKN